MVSPATRSIYEAQVAILRACQITQVTPLLVSFDGGTTSVPADSIAGAFYEVADSNNARAIMDSPNKPLVFPIG